MTSFRCSICSLLGKGIRFAPDDVHGVVYNFLDQCRATRHAVQKARQSREETAVQRLKRQTILFRDTTHELRVMQLVRSGLRLRSLGTCFQAFHPPAVLVQQFWHAQTCTVNAGGRRNGSIEPPAGHWPMVLVGRFGEMGGC